VILTMVVAIYVTLKLASPTLHPLNEFFRVKVAILQSTPNLFIGMDSPGALAM
jgi:hypothetical protein